MLASGNENGGLAVLQRPDEQLINHPMFGDSLHIHLRADAFVRSVIDVAFDGLSPDRESVAEAWISVMRDPIVRGALGSWSVGRIDRDDAVALFESAARAAGHSQRTAVGLEAKSGAWLDLTPGDVWLWGSGTGPLCDRLRSTVHAYLAEEAAGAECAEVAQDQLLAAAEAVDVLMRALPKTSSDALSHLRCIIPVRGEGAFLSSTSLDLPGVAFVNEEAFNDRWELAEALLHESLHSKLHAIEMTGPLMRPWYNDETSQTTRPVWHSTTADAWPTDRVLAAFHVYSHLAFLYGSEFATCERSGARVNVQKLLFRAHFLAARLQDTGWADLSSRGRALVEWLQGLLPEPFGLSDKGLGLLRLRRPDAGPKADLSGNKDVETAELQLQPLLGGELWLAHTAKPVRAFAVEPFIAASLALARGEQLSTCAASPISVEALGYLAQWGLIRPRASALSGSSG